MTPRWTSTLVTHHAYQLPRPLPDGLNPWIELWLVEAAACCSPTRSRWPLCYALARRAEPDTMTVGTSRTDWEALRRLGGLSWYWPSLAVSCRYLAEHRFLEPVDEFRWKLTLPGQSR